MFRPIAPTTFESSVQHAVHREGEYRFVIDCRPCGDRYDANYAPDLSWRTRYLMRDLTIAAHERICVVHQAMCIVEAAES